MVKSVLALRRSPKDSTAARRPRPLVKIPGIPVDAERRNIERNRAGRVRAIDQNGYIVSVAAGCDLGHRQDESAFRSDVVDERQTRSRADRPFDGFNDTFRPNNPLRKLDYAHLRAMQA